MWLRRIVSPRALNEMPYDISVLVYKCVLRVTCVTFGWRGKVVDEHVRGSVVVCFSVCWLYEHNFDIMKLCFPD